MGLNFGWVAGEVRESYWIDDPDLVNVTLSARADWEADGDASHLRPFVRPGGHPTLIRFRTLTSGEQVKVQSLIANLIDNPIEAFMLAYEMCFRIAVEFPELPAKVNDAGGAEHERLQLVKGTRMLADEWVRGLKQAYPGIVTFYGRRVYEASVPSEPEKKASSPPSIATPSSEVANTKGDTASVAEAVTVA